MKNQSNRKDFSQFLPLGVVSLVLAGILIYALFKINTLSSRIDSLTESLASTTEFLTKNTNQLSKNYTDLSKQTTGLSNTLSNTQQNIDAVKTQVGGVVQTVSSISGTVGTLQKLSEVDTQLLKKYSKVYFMNENYTPAHLTFIPKEYLYNESRQEQFLTEAWPALKSLLDAAKSQGSPLYIKSGYRSFREQKSLKSNYSFIYGAGTSNAFSADQGYSEHQLGTTVDFITTGTGGNLYGFDGTPSYTWLLNNAHLFGFVLSYPKGNAYYMYEPWHWRYVGVKLATYLHVNSLHFYDMDQRDIDKYLIDTF